MARITRRPLAAADILDIWDHIAEDSIEQADRWVDKLDEKFELIATQPLMGRARAELAASVRSFPFGRYVIFYAPIEGGIDVVRVRHSAHDIDAVFGAEQLAALSLPEGLLTAVSSRPACRVRRQITRATGPESASP
jgi:toxin ParE1/3/4